MKIYLVRHGQTLANAQKRYLGKDNSPFTPLGIEQNKNTLSKLAQINFDSVYSSPSERCLSIAQKITSAKMMDAIADKRLAEINFGTFEGLTWQEAREKYPDEFESLCQNPLEFRFPGGESQKELDIRIRSILDEITQSEHENIAVFSHGGAIMSILSQLLELSPQQKWRFKISHGAVAQVAIEDGYAYLNL